MEVDEEDTFKRPAPPKDKKEKGNFSIYEIFNFAQKEETDLNKLVKKMLEMFKSTDFNKFTVDLKKCIQFVLCSQEKCKQVDKCLTFIIKFVMKIVSSDQVKKHEEKKARNESKLENEETQNESKQDNEESDDDDEPNHPLLRYIFFFLFEINNVEDPLIRYRVCFLLAKLLAECSQIDDDIFDELSRTMLDRIQDKVANVRVQAVNAVYKLQDKTNPECPIKAAFKFHLAVDPSADVRKSVVRYIAINVDTVSVILGRLDDTSDKVRKHLYLSIAKQNINNFTIRQRQTFIKKGLQDRNPSVRSAVENTLLPVWFSRKSHDYLEFLNSVDVEVFEKPALQALEILAKKDEKRSFADQFEALLNDSCLFPLDQITPNKTLFWRFVTSYLAKEDRAVDDEDEDDQKLPKLTDFAKYIRAYYLNKEKEVEVWKQMQTDFNLIQLLTIVKLYDFKDEVGRSHIERLCIDLLKCAHVTASELITTIIELFALVVRNDETRLNIIAEVISDLREPLVNPVADSPAASPFTIAPPPAPGPRPHHFSSIQQARLTVDLDVMEDALREAVDEGDFEQAKELCQKVSELKAKLAALGGGEVTTPTQPQRKAPTEEQVAMEEDPAHNQRTVTNDPRVIRKCLRILIETFQIIRLDHLTPTLRSLAENVVMPCMMSENNDHWDVNEALAVRRDSVEALGLLCVLDEYLAVGRMPVFVVLLSNPAVTDICLKTIFDLLCKYGLEVFGINSMIDEYLTPSSGRIRVSDEAGLFRVNVETVTAEDFTPLIGMLVRLVDSEHRNRALVGLCKLLFIGRLCSSVLLSKLIVFWFSPDSSSDLYVQQQLGNFFSKFASVCPQAPNMLTEATLPSINLIAEAPPDSPLGEVDVDNALKLLIQLTCQQKCTPPKPHDVLARDILMSMIERKNKVNQLILIKALHKLEISYNCSDITEELLNLAKTAENTLRDKGAIQKMKVFRLFLENQISNIQKSTLINTRNTMDTRNTLSQHHSRASSQAASSMGNIIPEDDVFNEEDEASQDKANELARRTSLLHLHSAGVVQEGSSDEEQEEESFISRRPIIIPPTPEPSDVEDTDDDTASVCSEVSRPKRMKRSERRF
uniref:Condensin complex subunit 3 n=1 Tax=Cacopsylla melanoneura TaxID=428564 RepID=A0A8D8WN30_9HEMI